jgi:hypothetical protein
MKYERTVNAMVALSSIILIYVSFIVPGIWWSITALLGIVGYVYIDEYVLLPRRQDEDTTTKRKEQC